MQLLLVAALIFASIVAVFALQNAQTVPIRFFAWERETSVAVIALGAAIVGALAAVLAGLIRQVALGLRHRQLKAELGRVQSELDEERETKQALLSELARVQAALQEAEAAPLPAGERGAAAALAEESAPAPKTNEVPAGSAVHGETPADDIALLQSVAAASADDSAGVVADEVEDDEPEFGDAEPGETESSEVFPDGDEAQSKTEESDRR